MAAQRRRRQRELTDEELDELEEEASTVRARPVPRRKFPLRTILFLFVLGALIVFAPQIVTSRAVRDQILKVALKDFSGHVTVESMSAGWLSPVIVRNVVVVDEKQQPLLSVARIESQRTLLGFAVDRNRLGTFEIEKPQIDLVLHSGGSNLESALASLSKKDSKGERVAFGVEVIAGQVNVRDADTNANWQIDEIQGSFSMPYEATTLATGKISAIVADTSPEATAANSQGELKARFKQIAAGAEAGGQIQLETVSLPISVINATLIRLGQDPRISGTGQANVTYEWTVDDDGKAGHVLDITELQVSDYTFDAPGILGTDQFQGQELTLAGKVASDGTICELDNVSLKSEVGDMELTGIVPVAEMIQHGNAASVIRALQEQDYSVRGTVDLAGLAQRLPGTLRIRSGTEITSGNITFQLASAKVSDRRTWEGKLVSSDLAAVAAGRPVNWQRPLDITLSAYLADSRLIIEKLNCVSSFLQAQAHGDSLAGQIAIQGDLAQLAHELEQFVDLGDTQLAGKLRGDVGWQNRDQGQIVANGQLSLNDLTLVVGDSKPWVEKQLVLTVEAQGVSDSSSLQSLDMAIVSLTSGADTLIAKLTAPVDDISSTSIFPLECTIKGSLESWAPRVQSVYPLAGFELGGQLDILENGTVSTTGLQMDKAKVSISQLKIIGNGLYIDDQELEAEVTDVRLDRSGQIDAASVLVQSYPVSIRADKVSLIPTTQGSQLSAAIGFRGDLDRILSCLQNPREPVARRMAGEALGQIQLSQKGAATDVKWSVDVTDFAYATPTPLNDATPKLLPAGNVSSGRGGWKTVWSEPQLKLVGGGRFDSQTMSVELNKMSVDSQSLQVDVRGGIKDITNRCVLDLNGEVAYDSASIGALLHGILGDTIQVEAQDRAQFALHGPARNPILEPTGPSRLAAHSSPSSDASVVGNWLPADLAAEANVGWSRASAYGMPIGPAAIRAKLAQGVLEMDPLDIEVSEGRLNLQAQVLFDRPDPLLIARSGPLLTNVRLAPEMCGQWLKYIMPMLADVTQAEGILSLNLASDAAIPIYDPLGGEVDGDLLIDSAEIGPGPMVEQLLSLVFELKSLIDRRPLSSESITRDLRLEIPRQRVPFHWKDRRVYHEQLKFLVRDVALRTSGSVGIDQTVDMVAEFPVPDSWIAKNPLLASLEGKSLKIPVSGTLSNPRVDRRLAQQFFKDVARETVTSGANKLLEGQINRGLNKLDKLLGPREPNP